MRRVWAWLAVLAMLALMGAGEALARSVALVIGNSVYRHAPPLDNPLNDARDVAASLKRLGFDVTILADADYTAMRRGLAAFQAKAAGADVALLYYAGHGVGVDGQSWLVPVDAKLARQEAVELEAISLRQALSAVGGARRLRLVVLDACRDDPFSRRMRAMRGSRRIARGLARIEPAGDTMVWYAAKDGSTASDGDGRNSPFSAAFLKHIERPGLELGKLFREIVGDVRDATKGDQIPWAYGTRGRDDFFFKRAAAAPPPPKTAAPSALERDRVAFELAMSIEDPKSRAAALRAFLKRYPRSSLRRSAESALKTAMKSVAMAPTKPAAAETSSRFEARLRAAGKKGAKECAACP
ncbi:MAG: caspase family protein, partial [Neomegalonema sp.]|nr:caspase family protein [Neomegalonema sp.]